MIQTYKPLSIVGLATVLVIASSAYSESDQTRPPHYEPTRNTLGHPDMQGIWDFRTLTPLERPKEVADKSVFSPEEAEVGT